MYPFGAKSGNKFKGILFVLVPLICLAVGAYLYVSAPDTPLNKAVKDIKAGKDARALPVLEELVRNNPEDATPLPWLARAYLNCDRIAEGRTALNTALNLHLPVSKLEDVVIAFANYYGKKGDFQEASKLFVSLAADAMKTGDKWDADLSSARAQLYINWAQSDINKGDLQAAAKHLEELIVLEPSLPAPIQTLIRKHLSEYYRELAANAELKLLNDELAADFLNKSLSVSEDSATRMALASVYFRQQNWSEAAQNYHRVVEIDANNLEARHRLVELFVAQKNYEQARDALLELVDKEKSIENFQLLAALQLKLGNKAGAVRALEDACELRKDDLKLLSKLKEILLSWSKELASQGKVDESLSVKGHVDRVAEMIAEVTKKQGGDNKENKELLSEPTGPRIALLSSRIWLARGSLTPEGEVNIKNISANPAQDLSLSVVFYDKTTRRSAGSVTLPISTINSPPMLPGAERTLYFSSPTTVAPDHQLVVLISWHGHVLKELPIVKRR